MIPKKLEWESITIIILKHCKKKLYNVKSEKPSTFEIGNCKIDQFQIQCQNWLGLKLTDSKHCLN